MAVSIKSKKPNQIRKSQKSNSAGTRWLGWLRNPKHASLAIFVTAFAGIGVFMLFKAFAITPQGTYNYWNWNPPADGYNSLKHTLTVEAVTYNAKYFWSHQFKFIGGDGGYIGLQSGGNRVNGTVGKTAIFSIFSSGLEATKGNCIVQQAGFDGYNTSGSSCRIPYEWVQGRTYEIRTLKLNSETTGTWWGGYVKDTTTGAETLIGKIKVPTTWKGHGNWSVMWTEYFGKTPETCDLTPFSKVKFGKPTAENDTVLPSSTSSRLGTSECQTSIISSLPDGSIQQQMGNSNYQIKL